MVFSISRGHSLVHCASFRWSSVAAPKLFIWRPTGSNGPGGSNPPVVAALAVGVCQMMHAFQPQLRWHCRPLLECWRMTKNQKPARWKIEQCPDLEGVLRTYREAQMWSRWMDWWTRVNSVNSNDSVLHGAKPGQILQGLPRQMPWKMLGASRFVETCMPNPTFLYPSTCITETHPTIQNTCPKSKLVEFRCCRRDAIVSLCVTVMLVSFEHFEHLTSFQILSDPFDPSFCSRSRKRHPKFRMSPRVAWCSPQLQCLDVYCWSWLQLYEVSGGKKKNTFCLKTIWRLDEIAPKTRKSQEIYEVKWNLRRKPPLQVPTSQFQLRRLERLFLWSWFMDLSPYCPRRFGAAHCHYTSDLYAAGTPERVEFGIGLMSWGLY